MSMRTFVFTGLALAALAGASALAAPGGNGRGNGNGGGGGGGGHARGRPSRAVTQLVQPATVVDENARGALDVKHFPAVGKRAERSWFKLRVGRLDGTDYTLWIDDPATTDVVDLVQAATLTANDDGAAKLHLDTKKGDTLPLGGTLATLAGLALEIRDGTGAVVLTGTVPTLE